MENIPGLDRHITSRRNDPFGGCEPDPICPDCEGLGYILSDPDKREMVCNTCADTWTIEDADTYMRRRRDAKAEREARAEDAAIEREERPWASAQGMRELGEREHEKDEEGA